MGRPGSAGVLAIVHRALLCTHLPELLGAPHLHLFTQWRAGDAECVDAREVTALVQLDVGFHAVGIERSASAKEGDAEFGGKTPQCGHVRVLTITTGGVAVVDAAGGAVEQTCELAIPHDPARGAVPVKALAPGVGVVAATDVVMQPLLGHGHDHRAAVTVHDGFGQSGGAAGVDDPQRMVKRQPQGFEGIGLGILALQRGPQRRALWQRGTADEVVMHQHMLHRGQRRAQFLNHFAAVEFAAAIAHAIARQQHLGFDLTKAVEHRRRAHVGRANAPHRTNAHSGQKADHGLGDVGQIGRHPVARLHALRLQVQGQRGHLTTQLRPAQLTRLAEFIAAVDRGEAGRMGRAGVAQYLVRIVHLRTGEPARAGHEVFRENRAVRRGRLQLEVIPDALPEFIQVGDRPAPQVVVLFKALAQALLQPGLVQAQLNGAWCLAQCHASRLAPPPCLLKHSRLRVCTSVQ